MVDIWLPYVYIHICIHAHTIKITMKYHLIPDKMDIIKVTKITNLDMHIEKLEPLYASGYVKSKGNYEK